MNYCAIDFGTSNSAIALPGNAGAAVRLVELEPGQRTMPTAMFYFDDAREYPGGRAYGRAAVKAYVEGYDGRLMRSMKSILGSSLIDQVTEAGGNSVRYRDVIVSYLRHLKQMAEAEAGQRLERVVMGRPVHFVDDDPVRDAAAESALAEAARSAGFSEIAFQFEPIAAAFDYESRLHRERLVLVADIGGGTSDFSLVRARPAQAAHGAQSTSRREDILAHHGVHIAGTDFDQRVSLAGIMAELGYRSTTPRGLEMPAQIYFELSTWHLINTLYTPRNIANWELERYQFSDARHHHRLMKVLRQRLGHLLAGTAEDMKIAVSAGGSITEPLHIVEQGLSVNFDEARLITAVDRDVSRIVQAALETAQMAGVAAHQVDALYFTGGSTGLRFLSERIAAAFPNAEAVLGDRFASVAAGLGIYAARIFG